MSLHKQKGLQGLDPSSLCRAWLLCVKPVTTGGENVFQRLFWKGMPNDHHDPLAIAGMELCLGWRTRGADPADEIIVSTIAIQKFLKMYKHSPKMFFYDYRIELLQLVDGAYGELLAKQDFQGLRDRNSDVSSKELRARLYIGRPDAEMRKSFRREAKIELPDFTVLRPVAFLPADAELNSQGVPILPEDKSFSDTLSNLEVDRLWELSGMIAGWISWAPENVHHRKKLKEQALAALTASATAQASANTRVQELTTELALAIRKRDQERLELERREKSFDQERKSYSLQIRDHHIAVTKATNEIRTLQGIRRKELETVSALRSSKGEASDEYNRAIERFSIVQKRLSDAPRNLEQANTQLASAKNQWERLETQLIAEVNFSRQRLAPLEAEVKRLTEAHIAAESALKDAIASRKRAKFVADDYL